MSLVHFIIRLIAIMSNTITMHNLTPFKIKRSHFSEKEAWDKSQPFPLCSAGTASYLQRSQKCRGSKRSAQSCSITSRQLDIIIRNARVTALLKYTAKITKHHGRWSSFLIPSLFMSDVLLGSYYIYWSYKCFDPYFLDQPVRIFVNGGKFSNQYV